jgi:hypothetical protein
MVLFEGLFMKTILLVLALSTCFKNSYSQSTAALDSLRYYPLHAARSYVVLRENMEHSSAFISFTKPELTTDFANTDFFTSQIYLASGDAVPVGTRYERIDSLTGQIIRGLYREVELESSWSTFNNGPVDLVSYTNQSSWGVVPKLYSYSITSLYGDSIDFPIEQLYFDTPPQIGDTVLRGSARFAGLSDSLYETSEISANQIVVIYRGYREVSDRDLGFDNPADTLIRLLDFEIRHTFIQDNYSTYTLAKDVGLIEAVHHFYPDKENHPDVISQLRFKLLTFESDSKSLSRNYLFLSNERETRLPKRVSLQAYPNPFNPSTTIRYTLNESSEISLSIYSGLGQLVQVVEQGVKAAGSYSVFFDAGRLASGVYVVRLQSSKGAETMNIVLLK